MSFERRNLHFSVRRKQPQLAQNFAELLGAGGWLVHVCGRVAGRAGGRFVGWPLLPLLRCHCLAGGPGGRGGGRGGG